MIHLLDSTASTNTYAKEHATGLTHGDIILTHNQTAGRGQRGNTWEAAPGLNLTFSLFLRPRHIAPKHQWAISQAVALGIASTLEGVLQKTTPGIAAAVSIKWPNDIYVGDRKICGILIEHSISAPDTIGHSIAGIGINVNQREFHSDAPNPVSLFQLTGIETRLDALLESVTARINHYFAMADVPGSNPCAQLAAGYHRRLWRRDGTHPFALPDGTRFLASITTVGPDGRLTLTDPDGTARSFYFKEVQFIL